MAVSSLPEPVAFLAAALRNLKALIQKPGVVASICPSFDALNESIASSTGVATAISIVELGPGNGETTRSLLSVMKRDSRLLVIEKTDSFLPALRSIDDSRLQVCHDDALDLTRILKECKLELVDVVITGIPFSTLSTKKSRRLIKGIFGVLRPGGNLIAYQFRDDVNEVATPIFGSPQIEQVWLNIPPLKIYRWTKGDKHSICA